MRKLYTEEEDKKTIEFPTGRSISQEEAVSGRKKAYRRITAGTLLMLFTVFYVPALLNWVSGTHIAQDVIRNGIIEEYIQVSAVLIRNEVLLKPPSLDGIYIPEIHEGEKAAAYSTIAKVMGSESDELLREIEDINAKIIKARLEQSEKSEFFSADLAKLDAEIGKKVRELIAVCNSKSFGEMGRKRTEIRSLVEKKAEIAAGDTTDEYINTLQKQKKTLQNLIQQNTVQIRTNTSGIVSYCIDGYEGILTPDRVMDMTVDELDSIRERCALHETDTRNVKKDKPFAKILKGIDMYMAADIPADRARKLEEGNSVRVRINSMDFETSATIVKIGEVENDRVVVVVRMSRGLDVLSGKRVVDADIITKTEEGLKVPLKCLMDINADGTRGRIMLVKSNIAVSREVEIVCSDEEYAIIRTPEGEYENTVNLYNIYIVNPDNIEEGEIIIK
ncbi:MAG TPA: HlyD family efflux transporter periplasmic adaptor subunit [Clostridiales bacterium]|nr:HlyD family efflux transporter periplasmic adaptor subunit [Clostridiales bacterium]HPV01993.1 HlyD family efflux transporter periplasmic adaptor subunit [Clostridiales bacterium]